MQPAFKTQKMWREFKRCRIAGVDISTASRAELKNAMVQDCLAARNFQHPTPRLVFDVNGHALSLRETSSQYREAFECADIVHADGGFLVTLSRWSGKAPIAERSATTDMIHDCARAAAASGLSFYLLGGTEAVVVECARRLKARYPKLKIVGYRNGYFDADEEDRIVQEINRADPDVLWVGLGKPKEQIFSVKWRSQLKAGWLVTCGGCYNYITGDYSRAPLWMQRAGLEWIFRATTNPRKLLWRYLTTTPHALYLVMRATIRDSTSRRTR